MTLVASKPGEFVRIDVEFVKPFEGKSLVDTLNKQINDPLPSIRSTTPEVPEALARLKARFKIVVLSNGDPDMLEAAKPYHGIPFDAVISAAAAHAFKPHVATYTRAAEIVGVPLDAVVFVANHAFDCIGAKSAGMHTAFVDRRRRPFGATPHQPDLIVADMTELADVLVGPEAVPS